MTRGEHMRAAREKKGLTIRELANRAGIHYNTLSALERDQFVGRIDTIELLAEALRVSLDKYVGFKAR